MSDGAASAAHGAAGVVVLGMHRSGTSAVTRAIHLLGVPVCRAADLMPPTPDNPRGYWESLSLTALNDEILRRLGGTWSGPPPLERGWPSRPELIDLAGRAKRAFRTAHPTAQWVWKDPRTCLTLPFWRPALGPPPAVVFFHRHPFEVWRSLEKRDGLSKPLAVALWERYTRAALENARGLPLFALSYERLLAEPAASVQALRAFLVSAGITTAGEGDARAVERSLDARLRHASFSGADLEGSDGVSGAQRALYGIVEGLGPSHPAFEPPPLPPETEWAALLLAEHARGSLALEELRGDFDRELRRRAEDRERLERVVDGLLARIDELLPAGTQNGGRPAFVPDYGPDAAEDREGYAEWLGRDARRSEARRQTLRAEAGRLRDAPSFSVLLAPGSPGGEGGGGSGAGFASQIHEKWEVLVPGPEPKAAGRSDEPRIRTVDVPGGAAASLGRMLDVAQGDFVGVLGSGDVLPAEALAELALAAGENPEVDVVYADSDRLDAGGRRHSPSFKPDWSPDHFLSENFLGRPVFVRRSLALAVGGFRAEREGAHEYDLLLRVCARARRITHVPRVFAHLRSAEPPPSPAADDVVAGLAAAGEALRDALAGRDPSATVEPGLLPGTFRVRRPLRSRPRVSVIIPFRDEAALTRRCIDGLHRTAGYDRWEAILVDNRSWLPETRALLARLAEDPKCRLERDDREFNWAALNNRVASRSEGEMLLFLNNDVEGLAPGWLEAMLEHAERKEVGAVGARLLYPNGLVQHAGVVLGLGVVAGHAFRYCPTGRPAYRGMDRVIRNWSAVTGACMLVRREVFDELGGFDEALTVAYNDVDFCLRARERGYLVVYTPFAELVHHESVSRGVASDRPEQWAMAERWLDLFPRDPYYNPNLSFLREDFGLPVGEEVPVWQKFLSRITTS